MIMFQTEKLLSPLFVLNFKFLAHLTRRVRSAIVITLCLFSVVSVILKTNWNQTYTSLLFFFGIRNSKCRNQRQQGARKGVSSFMYICVFSLNSSQKYLWFRHKCIFTIEFGPPISKMGLPILKVQKPSICWELLCYWSI